MSYAYPRDRHPDSREKGAQSYKGAREEMRERDVQLQTEAEAFGESHLRSGDEPDITHLEVEAEERIWEIHTSRERSE